jgi:hypothetical protein
MGKNNMGINEKHDHGNLTLINLAIKEGKLKVDSKIDIKCKIEKINSSL